jgi:hypothetical protein
MAPAGPAARLTRVLHRPRLWRATAALSAVLLAGLLALAVPGAISVRRSAAAAPAWARPCVGRPARADRPRVAFCARVAGRVVAVRHGPNAGETHLALVSRLHLFVVLLPDGARAPGPGSRLTAVGPLVRARNGLREVQAFTVDGA